ncbi:hypothetical protein SO802_015307 [Lithocarpus litseifolius]|uniref:DUF7588 domain-containing protein n=1 Tax=Lithocarpus litseifolius TaxID=425828 RepID=A0AAW2CTV3_9ROSI
MALKKDFTPDLVALGKEFDLEKNRVKREAYRTNHTLEQKKEVLKKWQEFMKEISDNIPFFEYFQNHFEWHKKACVIIKTNWTKEDTKEVVQSSHPPQDIRRHRIASKYYRKTKDPNTPVSNQTSKTCRNSCYRNEIIPSNQVSILSKQEELLLDLIEQIDDPIIKAQKLSAFHATLVRETSKPEPRLREPKVDLEKIYERFSKSKKEVTVNDLQTEIKETKSEVRTLRQELTILRVNNTLLDQRVKNLENTSHQGNKKGPSFQNPSDDKDETVNPTANMVQEKKQPSQKFLETINKINFQKWHSKVRIVISKDFEFEVIALMDSGADLNCESLLIPLASQ